jgi:hypothetical protein
MKLPNVDKAIIRRAKIVDYLLSPTHRDGRGKAGFFTRFGFTADAWEMLAEALRLHATECDIVKIEVTPFGTRYVIEGALNAPDGRRPQVRVIWFIEMGSDTPHLATAYPL